MLEPENTKMNQMGSYQISPADSVLLLNPISCSHCTQSSIYFGLGISNHWDFTNAWYFLIVTNDEFAQVREVQCIHFFSSFFFFAKYKSYKIQTHPMYFSKSFQFL